jgi:hypothetical protein
MRNQMKGSARKKQRRKVFCKDEFCRILRVAMAKKSKSGFSATKAVKANARARVGQPKASRILPDAPRTGRKAKYKPKMDELVEGTRD